MLFRSSILGRLPAWKRRVLVLPGAGLRPPWTSQSNEDPGSGKEGLPSLSWAQPHPPVLGGPCDGGLKSPFNQKMQEPRLATATTHEVRDPSSPAWFRPTQGTGVSREARPRWNRHPDIQKCLKIPQMEFFLSDSINLTGMRHCQREIWNLPLVFMSYTVSLENFAC